MSQYWWILEHLWCTSFTRKCDISYLRSFERAVCTQEQTILEYQNGLVLANTRVPVAYLGLEEDLHFFPKNIIARTLEWNLKSCYYGQMVGKSKISACLVVFSIPSCTKRKPESGIDNWAYKCKLCANPLMINRTQRSRAQKHGTELFGVQLYRASLAWCMRRAVYAECMIVTACIIWNRI